MNYNGSEKVALKLNLNVLSVQNKVLSSRLFILRKWLLLKQDQGHEPRTPCMAFRTRHMFQIWICRYQFVLAHQRLSLFPRSHYYLRRILGKSSGWTLQSLLWRPCRRRYLCGRIDGHQHIWFLEYHGLKLWLLCLLNSRRLSSWWFQSFLLLHPLLQALFPPLLLLMVPSKR